MTALVLGHKNPDTDSIVSALSATNLYRGRGIDVKAVAQGTPAPETAFVLERFNLTAPEVCHSVAGQEVYLVDYSDLAQAPDDFAQCKLLGIIDHHKLGDVTLIPMGPALVGLSTGDIASMAYNMQVAFATTVVGLFSAAIGFVTKQTKNRWYTEDMSNLEFMADLLEEKVKK